jgi:hypothetical protein
MKRDVAAMKATKTSKQARKTTGLRVEGKTPPVSDMSDRRNATSSLSTFVSPLIPGGDECKLSPWEFALASVNLAPATLIPAPVQMIPELSGQVSIQTATVAL